MPKPPADCEKIRFCILMNKTLAEALKDKARQEYTNRNKLIEKLCAKACSMEAVIRGTRLKGTDAQSARTETEPPKGMAKYEEMEV